MPQYRCLVQANKFPREKKAELAQEITRIHCELTGAPAHFVHVLFSEFSAGEWFTAGEPSGFSIINALIRSGRSDDQKSSLLAKISSGWSRISGQSKREIVVTVTEMRSEHWMEAGQLMPQPGGEKEWFARLGISI
ncbi:MAG TPA: tautomerase family protein [Candidatus Limnocylindrales bacterium]|nr:tautomerase family protein [Candidatus Limnocylindrales bacterium]